MKFNKIIQNYLFQVGFPANENFRSLENISFALSKVFRKKIRQMRKFRETIDPFRWKHLFQVNIF